MGPSRRSLQGVLGLWADVAQPGRQQPARRPGGRRRAGAGLPDARRRPRRPGRGSPRSSPSLATWRPRGSRRSGGSPTCSRSSGPRPMDEPGWPVLWKSAPDRMLDLGWVSSWSSADRYAALLDVSRTFYPDDLHRLERSAVVPTSAAASSDSTRRCRRCAPRQRSSWPSHPVAGTRTTLAAARAVSGRAAQGRAAAGMVGLLDEMRDDRAGPGDVEPPAADRVRQDRALPCRRLRDVDAPRRHVAPGLRLWATQVGAGARCLRRLG